MSDDDEDIELGEPDELIVYNQSMSVIAELKSRVRELDAELKAEKLSKSANAALVHEKNLELTQLRSRHAALVVAFEQAEGEHPLSCEYADDARYTWPDRWVIIKAALAEVKG